MAAAVAPQRSPRSRRRPFGRSTGWRFLLAAAALLLGARLAPLALADLSFEDYSLPVQEGPVHLDAADCNGDGFPDLLVTNQDANNVTILRNRGDGTFVFSKTLGAATAVPAATATPTGGPVLPTPTATPNGGPDKVAGAICAELTGDTGIDVAYASRNFGTVTIRRREDTGDFTVFESLASGSLPVGIAKGDVDKDGNFDLVVLNAQSSDITIFFGDGNGGFPRMSRISLPTVRQTNRPVALSVDDFDLDGTLDILVASQGDPPIRLLRGLDDAQHPAGTFAAPEAVFGSSPFLRPQAMVTTDIDGDHIPDLAVLSRDNSIKFFLGDGTGHFSFFDVVLVPDNTSGFALADFDGDHKLDLAVAYYKTNDVQVWPGTGPAAFTRPDSRFSVSHGEVALSDVFNPADAAIPRSSTDGTQLVMIDRSQRALELVQMTTPTTLTSTPLIALTDDPQNVLLTDMNGDGTPDAVVVSKGHPGATLRVLIGDSSGGFAPPPLPPAPAATASSKAPRFATTAISRGVTAAAPRACRSSAARSSRSPPAI